MYSVFCSKLEVKIPEGLGAGDEFEVAVNVSSAQDVPDQTDSDPDGAAAVVDADKQVQAQSGRDGGGAEAAAVQMNLAQTQSRLFFEGEEEV